MIYGFFNAEIAEYERRARGEEKEDFGLFLMQDFLGYSGFSINNLS